MYFDLFFSTHNHTSPLYLMAHNSVAGLPTNPYLNDAIHYYTPLMGGPNMLDSAFEGAMLNGKEMNTVSSNTPSGMYVNSAQNYHEGTAHHLRHLGAHTTWKNVQDGAEQPYVKNILVPRLHGLRELINPSGGSPQDLQQQTNNNNAERNSKQRRKENHRIRGIATQ